MVYVRQHVWTRRRIDIRLIPYQSKGAAMLYFMVWRFQQDYARKHKERFYNK